MNKISRKLSYVVEVVKTMKAMMSQHLTGLYFILIKLFQNFEKKKKKNNPYRMYSVNNLFMVSFGLVGFCVSCLGCSSLNHKKLKPENEI